MPVSPSTPTTTSTTSSGPMEPTGTKRNARRRGDQGAGYPGGRAWVLPRDHPADRSILRPVRPVEPRRDVSRHRQGVARPPYPNRLVVLHRGAEGWLA